MAILTEDMKRMIAELRLSYVATVTPEGNPNLSPKASLRVWDDDHLAFIDIASPNTVRNLKSNPHIEVNIVDPFRRRGYRFKGVAEIIYEGDIFTTMAGELWAREGRQYPANGIVKIRVTEALPVKSPAYMFNRDVREDDVRRVYLNRYGLRDAEPAENGASENSRVTSGEPRHD
ncbi:MAG: pyridoxamine 5'-phosphate oxidase family protein [Candidatus Binataceae bacterium]